MYNCVITVQFRYCIYLIKPWNQQLLHNSYSFFICTHHDACSYYTNHILPISTNHETSYYYTIHTFPLSVQPWNQQLLLNSYIVSNCTNHETNSKYTIHTLPLTVQTMKAAVITQFILKAFPLSFQDITPAVITQFLNFLCLYKVRKVIKEMYELCNSCWFHGLYR